MDFSALLAKEIAKKKAAAENTIEKEEDNNSSKKYFRRSDVERERLQKYREDQAKRDELRRIEHDKRRREREEEEAHRNAKRLESAQQYLEKKRLKEEKEEEERLLKRKAKGKYHHQSETSAAEESQDEKSELAKLAELNEEQIIARLRKLKEPVRLFSESDRARLRRLRKAEFKAENSDERIEQVLSTIDYSIIGNEVKTDRPKVYLQMEAYIRFLLKEWERVLVVKDDTPEQAFAMLAQTRAYLKPLLEQLRNKSLHEQIYPSLATLMIHLQQRAYRNANDTYLKLSIGNAAWPIGVIAVGIHERSANERITGLDNEGKNSVQIAHVMSDEKTRKWLTAIKRLITFAENQWPE
ncbi:hypothetical protein V1512DRAFT_261565 [Lipomyces arxii]|uniref:uncharacterized protein n=1 Tax=Lipomyces arxii TaxID=56418 RepID=UPI0034CD3E21